MMEQNETNPETVNSFEQPRTPSARSQKRARSAKKIHPSDEPVPEKEQQIDEKKDGAKKEGEEEEKREQWSGKFDFFLSSLSYSVGLGAVWRFPYVCYKNGGGAFLVPFFIFLVLVGIPLMYLETSVGQFSSRGPILSWVMVRLFKGVGISMNIINHYVNIYYIMVLGYAFYYLVLSIRAELPWEKCGSWASPNCVDDFRKGYFVFDACKNETNETMLYKCEYNGRCYNLTLLGSENTGDCQNEDYKNFSTGYFNPVYPSQDYWKNQILQQTPSMNETGGLVWQLVVSLLFSWIVCFLALFKGVKVSGKIVYFTALFPYLVLLILGIKGWTLDGAEIGIKFYITPDWSRLSDSAVWNAAAVQVFFTLSLSYGGLVALSSYNPYRNNILRDTIVLSISNFLTCILAGFVVFSYMGYLSKVTGLDIDKVVQAGQGLTFVVYPYAVTTIPPAPLWSVFFFVMILSLGMGTMMASVETLVTSLEDFFPKLKKPRTKIITLAIICVMYFLKGLLLTSQAGTYWLELMDTYSANYAILIIAFAECLSVSWFFGTRRFLTDISTMLDISPKVIRVANFFWIAAWKFVTPLLLAALTIFSWYGDSGTIVTEDGEYPAWSNVVGHLLSVSSTLGIIGWMVYEIGWNVIHKGEPFSNLLKEDPTWRPKSEVDRQRVKQARIQAGYERPQEVDDLGNQHHVEMKQYEKDDAADERF